MKPIPLSNSEATQAARLKLGETITIIRPYIGAIGFKDSGMDREYLDLKYHPGDILVCKERWCETYCSNFPEPCFRFATDFQDVKIKGIPTGINLARSMPIEHARTWLRVQDVKVNKMYDTDKGWYLRIYPNEKEKAWNRRYPKHKWTPDLLVCIITCEKVSRNKI